MSQHRKERTKELDRKRRRHKKSLFKEILVSSYFKFPVTLSGLFFRFDVAGGLFSDWRKPVCFGQFILGVSFL